MGVPESQWNSASAVIDPDGAGPRVYFQRVPEEKATKNRLHLDIRVRGGREAIQPEVDRLVALGATVVGPKEERGEYWVVLQDPEGNEFCLT
jgi:predicted enzyme related to lactoylglutathione lyase